MSMMKVAIRGNMYVATFVEWPAKPYASETCRATLCENGSASALEQSGIERCGGGYTIVVENLRYSSFVHSFSSYLYCRFSLMVDFDLQYVEPLDGLTKGASKWFLDNLALLYNK